MNVLGSAASFVTLIASMSVLFVAVVFPMMPLFAAGLALLVVGIALARVSSGKSCPACAEKVKSAADVCRYCGHRFT